MLRRAVTWLLTWIDELVVRTGWILARADRRWYRLYMDWLYRLEPGEPGPPP